MQLRAAIFVSKMAAEHEANTCREPTITAGEDKQIIFLLIHTISIIAYILYIELENS
jgi:hypothetical protein